MSDTYSDDPTPDQYPYGTPGLCDRCADDESGESTGVYNQNPPGEPENWTVCPCGTEPEVDEE